MLHQGCNNTETDSIEWKVLFARDYDHLSALLLYHRLNISSEKSCDPSGLGFCPC